MVSLRRVIIALAVAMAAASVCHAQQTASISLIHHNIASGGQPRAAADHIVDLMNMTPQKALVLCNEAGYARAEFTLPHPGWNHIWPATPHEGRGNPSFTRNAAATLIASWVMTMTQEWTHLQPKDPRVFTVVKCELVSNPWVQFHCINVHFPTNRDINEPARQEAIDRLIEASRDMPVLPLIICGDFNMGATEARQRIANQIGGRVYSDASVDHIILRDGQNVGFDTDVTVTRLGQFISDHQALRYNFTFKELSSGVADWSLY